MVVEYAAFLSNDLAYLASPHPLQGDLRLLCPSGGCKTLEEFQTCNLATAPGYAGTFVLV